MDELDYQERREAALVKAEQASAILDQFAHGPANLNIPTQSGQVKTLAYYNQQIAEVTTSVEDLVIDVANLLDTLP